MKAPPPLIRWIADTLRHTPLLPSLAGLVLKDVY